MVTDAPPNLLLISLDACRADHLNCYGYERNTAPFLQRQALRGRCFTHAYVNTFGTGPSHSTLLSSLYQESHRLEYHAVERMRLTDPLPKSVPLLQEFLRDGGYITLGVTDGGQLARYYGFQRGFTEYIDNGGGVEPGSRRLVELVEKYTPTGKPLFLFFHTYEIHSPYDPPEAYRDLFGQYECSFPADNEHLLNIANTAWRDLAPGDLEYLKAMYDGDIRYTDEVLKELFRKLESIGFLDHYLCIITADHGEEFCEHGGLLHRNTLYDELLHVPLIITGSGISGGMVGDRMVSLVDVAPTLLDAAHINIPSHMRGSSLLKDPAGTSLNLVFSQFGNLRYSVRTPQWKLIETSKPPRYELYNMKADPGEQKNLVEDNPGIVGNLREHLAAWRARQLDFSGPEPVPVDLPEDLKKQLKSLGYMQ